MVSVDQAYMVGHMKNADGSINNKNVVLSAGISVHPPLPDTILPVHRTDVSFHIMPDRYHGFSHIPHFSDASPKCC